MPRFGESLFMAFFKRLAMPRATDATRWANAFTKR